MKLLLKFSIFLLTNLAWSQSSTRVIFKTDEKNETEYEYVKDKTNITVFDYQEYEYDYIKIPDFASLSAKDNTSSPTTQNNSTTPNQQTTTHPTSKQNLLSKKEPETTDNHIVKKITKTKKKKKRGVLKKITKKRGRKKNTPVVEDKKIATIPKVTKKEFSFNEMDSIWKKNLYSSNLYNDINEEVINYDSENIDFNELPTKTLIERLEQLNEKTPFDIEYNPILENVIKKYLKKRRYGLEKIIRKSYYYFPLFEKELDHYNIPMEIKYLAVVESALIPKVKSHVGATGLWQFMYETGRMHDLKINSYVDERMDPLKSTKAACEYLKSLHKMFNDWDLALAAYNSGPGNVLKAIKRSGGKKNYWNIRHHLPKETAGYLPAFLATMYLFEYAKEHGLRKSNPKYVYFETDTVKVKKKVTFKEIATAIDIDIEELRLLNPSYKLNIVPKSSSNPYSLRLPINKMNDFITYEEKLYQLADNRNANKEKSMYYNYSKTDKFTYTVRSGDYLGKIANRFNTTISLIKSWNNLRSSKIKIGQKLTIYNKKKVN